MTFPLCSIIIPVLNQLRYTSACLERIFALPRTLPIEVIVFDNGSSDGTTDYLKTLQRIRPELKVLGAERNLGYSEANNLASREARGDFLVLLNNDTLPTTGWLEGLYAGYLKTGASIAGSLLLDPISLRINHAGYVFNRNFKAFYGLYADCEPAAVGVQQNRKFQALLGACLFLRKQTFDEVGGLSSFALEDIDLALKIGTRGGSAWLIPASVVMHFGSVTLKDTAPEIIGNPDERGFQDSWPVEKLRSDDVGYYEQDGFLTAARVHAETAVQSPRQAAGRLIQLANESTASNQIDEAASILREGLALYPLLADFYIELMTIYGSRQDSKQAREIAEQLCRTNPGYEESRAVLRKIEDLSNRSRQNS